MKVSRKQLIIGIILTAVLGLAVFLRTGCQQQKQAGPPEKITIAHVNNFNGVLVQIAFTNGYFAQEGLEATPQPHAFGKLALQSVIEGKADIATVGDTPIVFAVIGGQKITILATIQTSNKNEAIIARRDRGIARPADLQGKKIGLTVGTTGDFFVESFLPAHGVDKKNVKIINLTPDEMAAALSTGKVDAAAIWNPTLIQLQKQLGSNGIMFFSESLYTETFCVVAAQEYAKNNPVAMEKVLRAILQAETFVREHPEESRRLVAEFSKTDKTILNEIWDIFTFRVALDQALLIDLEEQTRWAIKSRLTERRDIPNYLDFIYVDGLAAIKPEAVRIIR
jgi:ABC-type nitrate/sulfonate/bicarbonate transport system substrate-binding protein